MSSGTDRFHRRRAFIICLAALGAGPLLHGCKSPEKEPPPPARLSRLPNPPEVRDVSLARPDTLRVGDSISIVLDAVGGQIPINWEMSGLPRTWERTTGDDGRFYVLSGRLPMGSSEGGVNVRINVTDGNGRRSLTLPVHINVIPKTYDFQPTLVRRSDDDTVREYELRLRLPPDWDPDFNGRLEIWADTSGLPAGAAHLRLWDDTDDGLDITQPIGAESDTAVGQAEAGESFMLSSSAHQRAIEDAVLRLTITSPGQPDFHLFKVRVTSY